MPTRSFYLLLLLVWPVLSQAQDVILCTNGNEIKAKVLVITPDRVAYLSREPAATPDTLSLAAADVFLIRYANGTREVLRNPALPEPTADPALDSQIMYKRGEADAQLLFRPKGAFLGTCAATVVGPMVGLGVGAAIVLTKPQPDNILVPDRTLLVNPNYMAGYAHQAQKKKLAKAKAGFGVGIGATTLLLLALVANGVVTIGP
ncbi:hypothetical protein LJY25_13195 [Hymenobacter sp. BT175]|uniref:hypothetical protein n=1 Tax=Hymenobacter translucens TaxID=2886507 RepID=UPI001D0ECE01|nr:hypothetical protein [Hymenobacter translucens]MCC2547405.1 hypothetical protein [Hymenobacter translucens]